MHLLIIPLDLLVKISPTTGIGYAMLSTLQYLQSASSRYARARSWDHLRTVYDGLLAKVTGCCDRP